MKAKKKKWTPTSHSLYYEEYDEKKPKNRVFCADALRQKMVFETKEKAERFMQYNNDKLEELNGKAPIRTYFCHCCGGWHLTSKENRYEHHNQGMTDLERELLKEYGITE